MPTNKTAVAFRERFQAAFEQSSHSSYSELSRAAGMSRPVTQKIISGAFDHSTTGPGVFSVKRMAEALGTSVSFLLSEDVATDDQSQSFFSGTGRQKSVMERLMETYWRGAGRLEAFDQLIEDCDVYQTPTVDASGPIITRVGKRTLFSGRLGGPFVKDAQSELDGFADDKKADVLHFHRRVMHERTAIGCAFLDHDMVTRPARVSAPNARLGLLVEDHRGRQSILVHAMPIPA